MKAAVLIVAGSLLLASCSSKGSPSSATSTTRPSRAGAGSVDPSVCKDKPWMQHDASLDERARRLVAALTLDQKISQLHGDSQPNDYRIVPGIPDLCVPDLTVTNGPAGVGASFERLNGAPATALPAPIALASTWDPTMATTFGTVIGAEMQETGRNVLEAPDVDLARVPYNGRTFEAFGEDPYLASAVAVPEIQAVQAQGIVAMAKHFVANNQEQDRTTIDAHVSERALQELYFPPFEAAVKQANVASIMCSYNQVNGTHACENSQLLDDVLRKQWGFAGFVQSDFSAAHSTVASVQAGLDLEMPDGQYYADPLRAAVQNGAVAESQLDTMLERRYTEMFKLGLFDRKVATSPIPVDEHAAAAQQIAEAGTVLLRNVGATLPIDTSRVRSIAVVGPWADRAATGGGGSSKVNPIRTITPVAGITARAGTSVHVVAKPGSDVDAAVAAASKADMAVVVVGEQLSEGTDRSSLSLPDDQDAFIEAVAAANPNTVVVLHAGAPVLMPWLDRVSAVVLGWYPGQEDGTVTARILFGDAEPGGRLAMTFPAQESDLPTSSAEQYPGVDGVENYSEELEVGYRHYLAKGITPLFPFGFGLSYSTFSIDDLHAPADEVAGQPVTVTVRVTNTGTRTASEVAQAYVESPASSGEPSPTLQGFAKVTLDPGASQTVTITLAGRAFEHWDAASHAWVPSAGTATLHVGTSSADTPLTAPVQVHS